MARDKTSNALDWKFRDMPEGVRNRWVNKYIPGKEGADWFFISDQRGEQ